MERGRLPVVAVLKGAVVGGGLELASATHLRVAEPSAFYALPEGQHGLFVGGGGSVRVPRLIGAHRMADMMLTGRVLDAEEGHALGLSHYLTGPGEGLARALELAQKIAANSPVTNFAVLQALPRIAEANPTEGYLLESLMAARRRQQRRGPGADAGVPRRAAAARCSDRDRASDRRAAAAGRRDVRRRHGDRPLPRLAASASAGCAFDGYDELHRWSVDGPRGVLVGGLGVLRRALATPPTSGCSAAARCRAREWFPGATLNYAEHAVGAPATPTTRSPCIALLADPRPRSS